MKHDVPENSWTNVASDLFHSFNKNHILLVDYVSKYFKVHQIQNLSSSEVITKMKPTFLRFGIPNKVVSDNEPQYISREYRLYNIQLNNKNIVPQSRRHTLPTNNVQQQEEECDTTAHDANIEQTQNT